MNSISSNMVPDIQKFMMDHSLFEGTYRRWSTTERLVFRATLAMWEEFIRDAHPIMDREDSKIGFPGGARQMIAESIARHMGCSVEQAEEIIERAERGE